MDFGIRVLVVDDMMTMRKVISKLLAGIGFLNIETAEDGKQAWDMIQKNFSEEQPYGFIVSDWNMPNMQGIDLLRHVRADERFSKLPFLMVTAEGEKEKVIEAVQAGVSNFIVKPFSQKTLDERIKKIF